MSTSKSKSERIVTEALFKAVEIIVNSRVHVLDHSGSPCNSPKRKFSGGSGSLSSSASSSMSSSKSRHTPFALDADPCKPIRDEMQPWKTDPYQPLVLYIFCSSHSSQDASNSRPNVTLLEKWSLQYNMAANLSTGMAPEGAKKLRSSQETTATLHEVYRHFSVFLRSLYSLVRALPAWTIRKKNRARLGFCFRPTARGEGGVATWSGSKTRRHLSRPLEFDNDAEMEHFRFSPIVNAAGGGGSFCTNVEYDSHAPNQLSRSRARAIPIPTASTSSRRRRGRPAERQIAHSMPGRLDDGRLDGHHHQHHHQQHHHQQRRRASRSPGPPLHSQPPLSHSQSSPSRTGGGYHASGASTDPQRRRHGSYDNNEAYSSRRRSSEPMQALSERLDGRYSTSHVHGRTSHVHGRTSHVHGRTSSSSLRDSRSSSGSTSPHRRHHSNPIPAPAGGFSGSYGSHGHSAGSYGSTGLYGSAGSHGSYGSVGRAVGAYDSHGSHGVYGSHGSRGSTPPYGSLGTSPLDRFDVSELYQANSLEDIYLSSAPSSSVNQRPSPGLPRPGEVGSSALTLPPRPSSEERPSLSAFNASNRTFSEDNLAALAVAAGMMTPQQQVRGGDIFTSPSRKSFSSPGLIGDDALALNAPPPMFLTDPVDTGLRGSGNDSAFVGGGRHGAQTFDYSDDEDDDDDCPFALDEDLRSGDGGRGSRRHAVISDFISDCKTPRSVPHFCHAPYNRVQLSDLDAALNANK